MAQPSPIGQADALDDEIAEFPPCVRRKEPGPGLVVQGSGSFSSTADD